MQSTTIEISGSGDQPEFGEKVRLQTRRNIVQREYEFSKAISNCGRGADPTRIRRIELPRTCVNKAGLLSGRSGVKIKTAASTIGVDVMGSGRIGDLGW